jgi:hypothetical protein
LILANFEDRNRCYLGHGGGFGKLKSLLELGKVGAWHRLDLMSVNLHELIIEIAGDTVAPLLVGVTTYNGCATTRCCGSAFCCTTSGTVGILVFPSNTLGIGFIISSGLS